MSIHKMKFHEEIITTKLTAVNQSTMTQASEVIILLTSVKHFPFSLCKRSSEKEEKKQVIEC